MKRTLFCLMLALLCLTVFPALADVQVDAMVPAASGYVLIHTTPNSALADPAQQDGMWLFLPAFADRQQITLLVDGQETPVDWASAQPLEDGVDVLSVEGLTLYVMQSQNLRALFLESDDPVNQGRAYLEDCDRHQNSTTASMALVDTDGTVDYSGHIKKLRGRGNGSWGLEKKPYQFKLDDKVDLLQTGDRSERNRTWVLLTDGADLTMLHNRIVLNLGLEMGLDETSHSEPVDLYYDGEYRGLYLLCEKVQLGEGRIEEMDSDKVMEEFQQNQNPDELPDGAALNAYGLTYHFVDGANGPEDPSSVAYMTEVESNDTLSDRAYFMLGDGTLMAVKNPENANQEMVCYISEKLESARLTLVNGGVNPENGHTIQQDFDVDAFARLALINEWAFNLDGFSYSSTWFVLPAGSDQFRPGPPWDNDLSMQELSSGLNPDGAGLKDTWGWLAAFYRCGDFVQRMQQIYQQEMYPLLKQVFFGEEEGTYLASFDDFNQQIAPSRQMTWKLFTAYHDTRFVKPDGLQDALERLKTFLSQRTEWLNRQMELVAQKQINYVNLFPTAIYLNIEDAFHLNMGCLAPVQVEQLEVEVVQEATEEDYAIYHVTAQLVPEEGWTFAPDVTLPDKMEWQLTDGVLHVSMYVQDPSYRPFWYDDTDYGMIFDLEYFAATYPSVAEECDNDPEAMLEHFLEEDIYRGRRGTWYFSPILTAAALPDVANDLGDCWELYYDDLMYYGWEEWPIRMNTEVTLNLVSPPEEE